MKKTKILCILLLCSYLTSCSLFNNIGPTYKGDYPDLYTAAVSSILWCQGHSWGADFTMPSKIELIETDKYGRTLFTYYESKSLIYEKECLALLISQKTENDYVYFYEDVNHFTVEDNGFSLRKYIFSEEQINRLKERNDWNKEINLDKCVKAAVRNSKPDVMIDEQTVRSYIDIPDDIDGSETIYQCEVLRERNDEQIFYGEISILGADGKGTTYFFGYISENDIKLVIVDDPSNCENEFIEFKKTIGWYS